MQVRFESLNDVLPAILARAARFDQTGDWPAEDLADLAAIGAWKWFVPVAFGGDAIDPLELHLRYEAIASASLATALVLSQRDSAVGLIEGSQGSSLRQQILPQMSASQCMATIGIAQLTTSRQGGPPSLRAVKTSAGYRIDGTIPWSTAAAKSRFVVAGAVIEDSRQILFALPTGLHGVTIQPPLPLVALRSTWTAQIDCRAVELDQQWLLRGPAERVLTGRSKAIPIGQAFLAFGLCRGALDLIAQHDSPRARTLWQRMNDQFADLRSQVLEHCQPAAAADAAAQAQLRGAVNDLAMRITQSTVALYKGSALLADHPAQRFAREAMFLLVWSCPDAVIDCTVNALSQA